MINRLMNNKLRQRLKTCWQQLHPVAPTASAQQRWMTELSVLLSAGIDMQRALALLTAQQRSKQRPYWQAIQQRIEHGQSLSASLLASPGFARTDVLLIAVAERGGQLPAQLKRLAELQHKRLRMLQQVRRALRYPAFVLLGSVLVSGFLLMQVVPSFALLYQGFGAELPGLTQHILDLSELLVRHGWLVLLVFAALFTAGVIAWKASADWRSRVHRLLWRLPLLGPLTQARWLAQWHRTLAECLQAGLPFLEALQQSALPVEESPLAPCQPRLYKAVSQGQRLSSALQAEANYPLRSVQMIATGEESGMLAPLLETLARQYESDLDDCCEQLLKLLEPVLMTILGVLIGVIVMALYLPLFQLGQVI